MIFNSFSQPVNTGYIQTSILTVTHFDETLPLWGNSRFLTNSLTSSELVLWAATFLQAIFPTLYLYLPATGDRHQPQPRLSCPPTFEPSFPLCNLIKNSCWHRRQESGDGTLKAVLQTAALLQCHPSFCTSDPWVSDSVKSSLLPPCCTDFLHSFVLKHLKTETASS